LALSDDETEVLQQTADLVLDIALDLDQLGAAVQNRPDLMTRHALDLDLLVPTTPAGHRLARLLAAMLLCLRRCPASETV
jgi:hypothetical protein